MHSIPKARRLRFALSRRSRRPFPARGRRKLLGRLLVVLLIPVVLAGTATLIAYFRTPLPNEPQKGVTDEGSTVYYADGRTPLFRLGANRETVRHDQIPDRLRWAVLAAEERGFYSGHGVSPVGTFRAVWKTGSGGEVQGGSTITQQLARNYFKGLSKDRTAGRKIKEIFISLKLDRSREKDETLDLYLNTIYFGRQTSGVQAAARAYFDKDVWQLDVAESALLAAMIQRPAYFKTQGDDAPARALRARWKYVLDGMVSMGKLSRADAARQRFPATRREWSGVSLSGQDVAVRQRVLDELYTLGIPVQSVMNGKLKVYTGLDRRWMAYAEQAMKEAREPRWPAAVRGGLIAVDRDGAVRAFYGGDPARSQYDSVFNPVAQAASTFKPYVLAATLRRGFTVKSQVSGRSPVKFAPDGSLTPMTAPGYLVDNDEKIGSLGRIDLVQATALSVNTGYVKLAFETGIANVLRTAQEFGVPATALQPFKGQAGIALGVANVSAATQAAGYAAFANGGTAVAPHLITKIVDAKGRNVPVPWRGQGRRVLTQEQAAQVTHALRATVTGGTGRKAALPGRETAGKTGTSDNNQAAWFVGYVPQLSAAVVMADTKGKPLKGLPGFPGTVAGDNVPATVWRSFMEKVTRGMPAEVFRRPAFSGVTANWDTDPRTGGSTGDAGASPSPSVSPPGQAKPQKTPPPTSDPGRLPAAGIPEKSPPAGAVRP
ncbi:transglycosylase domain-containing protein [Actinomadura vinacea]|uniref:Transglycosylase domain-containing protein n=1 Tax=Actinomadura vinacea TaxID=115336 RepID=A0ABN3IJ64_9ACTN